MPYKISEIIHLAEQGALQASAMEVKDLYGLLGELALHVANLEIHIKRLERTDDN